METIFDAFILKLITLRLKNTYVCVRANGLIRVFFLGTTSTKF